MSSAKHPSVTQLPFTSSERPWTFLGPSFRRPASKRQRCPRSLVCLSGECRLERARAWDLPPMCMAVEAWWVSKCRQLHALPPVYSSISAESGTTTSDILEVLSWKCHGASQGRCQEAAEGSYQGRRASCESPTTAARAREEDEILCRPRS